MALRGVKHNEVRVSRRQKRLEKSLDQEKSPRGLDLFLELDYKLKVEDIEWCTRGSRLVNLVGVQQALVKSGLELVLVESNVVLVEHRCAILWVVCVLLVVVFGLVIRVV